MAALTRFSVSIEATLLAQFDRQAAQQGCPTRSKAIADLIRDSLVRHEWKGRRDVAAAIVMVYDHHKHDLTNRLTHIQHDHHKIILSTQHIHLDHDNCLEIVVVRGRPSAVEGLANMLKATKGIKFCSVVAASTGANI